MNLRSRIAIAAVMVSTGVAGAQITSGNLVGTVKDSSGAVVPGAQVSVRNTATNVTTTATANGSGEYRVNNLLPGTYSISTSAPGFTTTTVNNVAVQLNATATSDVTLQVGSAGTTVEVTSSEVGLVLDTTSQNLTTTFDPQEIQTLPVTSVGEGVLNLSLLAPGVGSTGGIGIGAGPSIAGQRPRNNNFTIEGIDNNNKAVAGPLVYVPNDAVGEFTLITTQFSPEFGHSSGGQFNTNILSGTNKFHGRVYEYFQNRDLNAAEVVTGTKIPNPRYDNNRYGGELGGPIVHDRLFFFGNYERNTIGQSSIVSQCVATAAGRATIAAQSGVAGYSTNNITQYLKYVPVANAPVGAACNDNPSLFLTSGPADANGNQSGTPQGTVALGTYQVNAPNFSNQDALTVGMDYTISPKDSFRARYVYNTIGSEDISANLPSFWVTTPTKFHLIALSEYHSFTPNLTNEVRVGFNRYANTLTAGNFSYPGLDSFPNLEFYDQGYLNVGPDGNAPQFTIQNLYQLTDNISYTKGKHTIKIGFDGRKYISPQGFTQRARGDYEWDYLSDFLHDYAPDAGGFGERSSGNHTYYGDQTAFYGYANDTWRVLPTLTFNFGARYEFTSVPTGERAQVLNSVASTPGLITFGVPQPSYRGIAPRLGIEYAPGTKTSIRAGYGLAYDVLVDNFGTLSFPPQYSVTQDVGIGSAPANSSPNFLANGGLKPGTGSGTTVLTRAQAIAGTSAYVPNQTLPYSENYTLTITREVAKGLNLQVGYIGDRGIHLTAQNRINIQPRTTLQNYLPTYTNGAMLNGIGSSATTLAAINAQSNVLPQYAAAGFTGNITSFQPYSGSNYNGLIAALQGRIHGVQTNLAYTFSKAMDNATAEVFSTSLTPRRPQNPRNLDAEYSRSALDHTHRLTLEMNYLFQPFSPTSNWAVRNIVGNWNISPVYTYESPEYATVLSGNNALLTGDGAYVGRVIINPNGVKGTASTVNPIKTASGATVGYAAVNQNAYYIQAGPGTMPNAARNTLPGRPSDNLDLAAYKRFTARERYTLELGAQAFNVLNHAQYLPGSVDNVAAYSYTGLGYTTVSSPTFNRPDLTFSNNPRSLQLVGKIIF